MERLQDNLLIKWKNDPYRKPLLLKGARQVGKTTTIRHFGQQFKSYVEINFEEQPALADLFKQDLKPDRIVRDLQLELGVDITPGETLLFFDEVQMCPDAMISLRYFYENLPDQHIIAAGSLLEFAIEKVGLPVGRVSFLYLHPMTFIEFLWALDRHKLAEEIIRRPVSEPFNEAIHQTTVKLLGEYMAIGGMPEAVNVWKETSDYKACLNIHKDILAAYEQDFEKYARTAQVKYVKKVFNECCHQVGKQFVYANIDGNFRARELSPAVDLLERANIITAINHTSAQGLPLAAQSHSKRFKLIMLDVALMQASLGVSAEDWVLTPELAFINKGAVAESFVGQELLAYNELRYSYQLHYWEKIKRSSVAEVDYLTIDRQRKIIPVEVKAGHSKKLKSLYRFLEEHPDSPYGIRYSMSNYSVEPSLENYPLYAVAAVHWNEGE